MVETLISTYDLDMYRYFILNVSILKNLLCERYIQSDKITSKFFRLPNHPERLYTVPNI